MLNIFCSLHYVHSVMNLVSTRAGIQCKGRGAWVQIKISKFPNSTKQNARVAKHLVSTGGEMGGPKVFLFSHKYSKES